MQETKPINYLAAGAVIGIVLVIYGMILRFTGLDQDRTMQWLSYLIFIIGIVIFIGLYAKAKDHFVTFGNLFAYGFKSTAIATVVLLLFLVIFSLLFPEYKDKVIEMSRTQMEDSGKYSEDQIDDSIAMIDKYYMIGMIGGTLIFMIIIGCVGSLIGAAITKKKPVNPFDQTNL
jgi:hypothetical protein